MMPTFPRPSLSFRTAGFPRYGWKVGLSDGAFPDVTQLKSAPDIRCITAGLHPPFVHLVVTAILPLRVGNADSIMHRHGGWVVLRPRGPRSGPGYSVPVRHHLTGPIRPTRRHIAISPHGGLYAMPSLCGERLGDPRVVPSFHCSFLPDMPSSMTPGSSASNLSSYSMSTWPSPRSERLGTPKYLSLIHISEPTRPY